MQGFNNLEEEDKGGPGPPKKVFLDKFFRKMCESQTAVKALLFIKKNMCPVIQLNISTIFSVLKNQP